MDKKLKHAVVVLAHDDMDTLIRLINSLDDDFDFYIHIDRNWIDFSEEKLRKRVCGSRIINLYSRNHVKWGSIDIIKTQMWLISNALSEKHYDYIHLMSGHDILLGNCGEIKDFFSRNYGKEFMEYHQLPFSRWEEGSFARLIRYGLYDVIDYNKKRGRDLIEWFIRFQRKIGYKRNIPTHYPRLFGGSNWMSLTSDCWRYVLNNYKKSFLRRLRFTFASDEVFYHTVVMNSVYAGNVTGNNLRLICWSASGAVKTLTKYDWWTICKSNALFARKVCSGISDELMDWVESAGKMREDPESGITDYQYLMRRVDTGTARVLQAVVSSLSVHSCCEFLCGNGIYVRFLRDMGLHAYGMDVNDETPDITRRLFPSGFHCICAELYESVCMDVSVELSMVLVKWLVEDNSKNETFISNLASISKRYVVVRNVWMSSGKQNVNRDDTGNWNMEDLDHIMEKKGFVRNETVSDIISHKMGHDKVGENAWLFYEKKRRERKFV